MKYCELILRNEKLTQHKYIFLTKKEITQITWMVLNYQIENLT